MTYAQKLRDPRWKAKRAEIIKSRNFQCEDCQIMQAGESWFIEFNVHHRYYEKGREPWEYPDSALACLCWRCHNTHHLLESLGLPPRIRGAVA